MIKWIILGIVVLTIVSYLICLYNSLIRSKAYVEEAFSTMDIYLKKRWDAIPSLVEIVKGYTKHEAKVLEDIIRGKAGLSYDSMSFDEKRKVNNQLSWGLNNLFAVVESYPELKAGINFQELSKAIIGVEYEIANSRKYYNACVRKYNNIVCVFPNVIFTRILGFNELEMFEIENEERDNAEVNFKEN